MKHFKSIIADMSLAELSQLKKIVDDEILKQKIETSRKLFNRIKKSHPNAYYFAVQMNGKTKMIKG